MATESRETQVERIEYLDAFGQAKTAPYRVILERGRPDRWCVARGSEGPNPFTRIGEFPNAGLARVFIDALEAQAAATGDDLVQPTHGCPACGERRMDELANDDGHITCGRCGTFYDDTLG